VEAGKAGVRSGQKDKRSFCIQLQARVGIVMVMDTHVGIPCDTPDIGRTVGHQRDAGVVFCLAGTYVHVQDAWRRVAVGRKSAFAQKGVSL